MQPLSNLPTSHLFDWASHQHAVGLVQGEEGHVLQRDPPALDHVHLVGQDTCSAKGKTRVRQKADTCLGRMLMVDHQGCWPESAHQPARGGDQDVAAPLDGAHLQRAAAAV